MNLSDFDFDLPETLIATRPMVPRSAAKLRPRRPPKEMELGLSKGEKASTV